MRLPAVGRRPGGRCGSALTRRVTLRVGRNARPVSSGPSGPTRGQGGAPAGRPTPSGRPRSPASRPRTNDLEAGGCRAGWYSPPGEGIGRTRPGAGSRPRRGRFRPPDRHRSRNCHAHFRPASWSLWRDCWHRGASLDGSLQRSLDPPLMGPSTPPSMGPSRGEGSGSRPRPVYAGQTLRGAGSRAKPPVTLPRYAMLESV